MKLFQQTSKRKWTISRKMSKGTREVRRRADKKSVPQVTATPHRLKKPSFPILKKKPQIKNLAEKKHVIFLSNYFKTFRISGSLPNHFEKNPKISINLFIFEWMGAVRQNQRNVFTMYPA